MTRLSEESHGIMVDNFDDMAFSGCARAIYEVCILVDLGEISVP